MKTWQTLLIQAFKQTPIKSSTKRHCGLISLNGFIYRALSSAGIENRNPFSLWQLMVIRFQSKGNPVIIRELCIAHIARMQKPVRGFYANAIVVGFIAVVISSIFLVLPQTATTFRTQLNGASILKQAPAPIPDIDITLVELSISGDYSMSAESINFLMTIDLDNNNSLSGKSWILNQEDSSYSLQLVAASNSSQLQKYCEKNKICNNSAIYQTEVNGKTIVRLLYGSFPSFAAANRAKTRLPASLQTSNPWARQFKRIKQEL